MNSLFQLEQNRKKAHKRYYKKYAELRAKISSLEKEIETMKYPHFKDYLNKLGKACLPLIKGAVSFELYGHFGLGNETSIYFHAKQKPGEKEGKTLASATFTSRGEGYSLKDYSKNNSRYPKGSIGEMNGMNYENIEITEKMTIEWFVRFAKKGYNKK